MADMEEIKKKLAQTDSTKIFFTDLNGRIMSLPVNPDNIESLITDGIGFDGSSVAGYASVETSDRLLMPDPDSFRVVKLADETMGFFIGHIYNTPARRAETDPRAILEKVIARAESEFGCRFTVGPEHEFFILSQEENGKRGHSDNAGYFLASPHDKGEVVRKRIIEILKTCGIRFEKTHHEVTPSQHEINLEPGDPLSASDRTILFNHITKKAAAEYGYHATFMPKPFNGYNRNAFHIHISMQDLEGKNLFYDEAADYNLSRDARRFIAGIIKYARETSIIMASTLNSYKAYVLEREAPIIRGWGLRNRSSMVRVPYASRPASTRLELRSPDPAGNVYLQMATLIAMGLQGLKEGVECGKPDPTNIYKRSLGNRVWDKRFLPKSQFEALVEAERGKFLKELLGNVTYTNYMNLKKNEWEDHRVSITVWEFEKYWDI